ncbi:unnamed protein product [Urochloa humidicola]
MPMPMPIPPNAAGAGGRARSAQSRLRPPAAELLVEPRQAAALLGVERQGGRPSVPAGASRPTAKGFVASQLYPPDGIAAATCVRERDRDRRRRVHCLLACQAAPLPWLHRQCHSPRPMYISIYSFLTDRDE